MNETNILIRNGFVPFDGLKIRSTLPTNVLATIGMNLSYYGFSLSSEGFSILQYMDESSINSWWKKVEPELKKVTGDDKNMGDFVVYKNFPKEVLDMSEGEYWIKQILMYWGLPNELFTQEELSRDPIDENIKFNILKVATSDSLKGIYTSLLSKPTKWTKGEYKDVQFLSKTQQTDFSKITFKENFLKLATGFIKDNVDIKISTATDVLRLAAGLSDQDISLREKVKFGKFKRPMRKYLLNLLEGCHNLEEDISRKEEVWKRFLHNLHAGDYAKKYPRVINAVNALYSGKLEKSYNSLVEIGLETADKNVLDLLKTRPGDFRRRLAHCASIFGVSVVKPFQSIVPKLNTTQLLGLRKYLETVNTRSTRVFPPRGNWNKLQIAEPKRVSKRVTEKVIESISNELKIRLSNFSAKELSDDCEKIKLPNNDNELSPYGRGTVFPIPDNINFIRSASYWKIKNVGNIWYDNGWNFFGKNWSPMGTCCWNAESFSNKSSIFSGDPTNSKEMKGRACQMIDLYLDKLAKEGVKYAVWNVLCYSNICFDDADEVYAALQWGEKETKGKLFEPRRAQLSFPLHGQNMTKYICYIDIEKREMVYMDANLSGSVSSAKHNLSSLSEKMPAFVDYLSAQPSVYDLFKDSINPENGKSIVLYSDKDAKLDGDLAYVFKPENPDSKYENLDINEVLQHEA